MNIALRKIRVCASKLSAQIFIGVILAAAMALIGLAPANAIPAPTSISGFVSTEAGQPLPAHSTVNLVDSTGSAWNVMTTVSGA